MDSLVGLEEALEDFAHDPAMLKERDSLGTQSSRLIWHKHLRVFEWFPWFIRTHSEGSSGLHSQEQYFIAMMRWVNGAPHCLHSLGLRFVCGFLHEESSRLRVWPQALWS